ncbi:MAG: cysteine synthase A [Polyangiaceae bacterium]|nr:cysteine synthase A [Polyangiaceae bacterium]
MRSDGKLPPLPARPGVVSSVLDLVGDTPLVKVARLGANVVRGEVFAKCEHMSPGGSVKDRICLAMIEAAERDGLIAAGGTVVEPTSGNTGIGLAIVCAAKGYRCILTMPASMSLERRQLLEAYGAQVVLTDPEKQMVGALEEAIAIAKRTPGSFVPSQFENGANPRCHEETTAEEILASLEGRRIDAFVAAVGTGGTVSGVGRALRRAHPSARIIAVEPESSATISRGERGPSKIQGIAAGFVPKNYDASVVSEVRTVSDRDAWDTKQALSRLEGLLVGISAGANVFTALAIARELGPSSTVVTVLCDTGERYFSLEEHFSELKSVPSTRGAKLS